MFFVYRIHSFQEIYNKAFQKVNKDSQNNILELKREIIEIFMRYECLHKIIFIAREKDSFFF